MTLWDNPEYAWQQQLVSGANLAKNLNPQALLGLALGTLAGSRLGNLVGNWQQESDFLKRRTNQLIDKGYSDVTYDKSNRRFVGVDANGNTIYFGRNGEIIPQQTPAVNPASNVLWQQGNFNLGWEPPKPQYQFPTVQKSLNDYFRPNPSSWDWRQNNSLRQNPPYFPMTPTTSTPPPQSNGILAKYAPQNPLSFTRRENNPFNVGW